ncbi:hypothetical protein BDB00DRAFT_942466, partial [Zychaea mexicana]|uniref:uncharacterized protein n=1 Tax=Zychaea mexicana TaxID=64656 RepID=UPI0022FEB79E
MHTSSRLKKRERWVTSMPCLPTMTSQLGPLLTRYGFGNLLDLVLLFLCHLCRHFCGLRAEAVAEDTRIVGSGPHKYGTCIASTTWLNPIAELPLIGLPVVTLHCMHTSSRLKKRERWVTSMPCLPTMTSQLGPLLTRYGFGNLLDLVLLFLCHLCRHFCGLRAEAVAEDTRIVGSGPHKYGTCIASTTWLNPIAELPLIGLPVVTLHCMHTSSRLKKRERWVTSMPCLPTMTSQLGPLLTRYGFGNLLDLVLLFLCHLCRHFCGLRAEAVAEDTRIVGSGPHKYGTCIASTTWLNPIAEFPLIGLPVVTLHCMHTSSRLKKRERWVTSMPCLPTMTSQLGPLLTRYGFGNLLDLVLLFLCHLCRHFCGLRA